MGWEVFYALEVDSKTFFLRRVVMSQTQRHPFFIVSDVSVRIDGSSPTCLQRSQLFRRLACELIFPAATWGHSHACIVHQRGLLLFC